MQKSNELLNKVIQLERNKNNYFINLFHELRTPLNVIFSTEQLITALNKKETGILRIKDTGIGIDKEYHEAIFDRFNQVVDTYSEVKGGSGLCLTITNIL